jgi:hypothetical protein
MMNQQCVQKPLKLSKRRIVAWDVLLAKRNNNCWKVGPDCKILGPGSATTDEDQIRQAGTAAVDHSRLDGAAPDCKILGPGSATTDQDQICQAGAAASAAVDHSRLAAAAPDCKILGPGSATTNEDQIRQAGTAAVVDHSRLVTQIGQQR